MSNEHNHDHPDFLGHHWDSPKQQFEAGKLGMWLFLATEVLLFGGLFCAYAIWRSHNPELFQFGSEYLDTKWGAINTAVLILSSLTMAWAVTLTQQNKRTGAIICLVLTLFGAAGFMGIKFVEYTHKFDEGLFAGRMMYEIPAHAHQWAESQAISWPGASATASFDQLDQPDVEGLQLPRDITVELSTAKHAAIPPGGVNLSVVEQVDEQEHGVAHPMQRDDRPANVHMFFNIYFMMTGLHGIHVILGGIVIMWLLIRSIRGDFSDQYFTPVDLVGLYWHVVDLIWIFLFPLFYLI